MSNNFHQPVLLKETLHYLKIKKNGKYIDATLGGGGHTSAILKHGGRVLAMDCDPEAITSARRHLSFACPAPTGEKTEVGFNADWRLARENFNNFKKVALTNNFSDADGILFDLGVSSYQLDTLSRGFSFKGDALLDMRMDPNLKVKAADLINGLNKDELEKLFYKLGQEYDFRRVAKAVVDARQLTPITSCKQLADLIEKVKGRKGRIHPATKIFQALRIAVNDELNNLKQALPQALEVLKIKGRLIIISFHSGEDRIVKNFFKQESLTGNLKILTKKPLQADLEEIKQNPRSRSAKLRAAEKI